MYFGFYPPYGMVFNQNTLAQRPGFPTPGSMFPIPGGPGYPGFPTPGGMPQMPGGGSQMPGGTSPRPGGGAPTQGSGAPTSAPPQQIPNKPQKPQGNFAYMIDANVLQPCLYRFTYVWLTDGSSFWFYPVALGANSVGGYYWDWNTFRWNYYALDTKYIDVVNCS